MKIVTGLCFLTILGTAGEALAQTPPAVDKTAEIIQKQQDGRRNGRFTVTATCHWVKFEDVFVPAGTVDGRMKKTESKTIDNVIGVETATVEITIEISDSWIDGEGCAYTTNWNDITGTATCDLTHVKSYKHWENSQATHGRINRMATTLEASVLIDLLNSDCSAALEAGVGYECTNPAGKETVGINFARGTGSASLGETEFTILGVSFTRDWAGGQNEGSYDDNETDALPFATICNPTTSFKHHTRGRMELWSASNPLASSMVFAHIAGQIRSSAELVHCDLPHGSGPVEH